jgi:CubicO group peptidase (beta-lactamase class C family)
MKIKSIITSIFSCLLLLQLLYVAQVSAAAALSNTDLASLRQYISDAVSRNHISGATLAIASENKTILLEAFGKSDIANGTDISTDTLFHIGSTNKAITSFLIGILVDEGVLQWDTKAIDIYSGFKLSNQDYAKQITIRQLLDMTSGLPKDVDVESAQSILNGLDNVALLAAPGKKYQYSNVSIAMVAYLAVLAKVKADNGLITTTDLDNLHASYEQLLREKVLVPLGMTDAYLYIDDARNTGKMTRSYHIENNTLVVSESEDQKIDYIAPAGGLKTSAGSLLRYIITEMQQGVSPEGTRILSSNNSNIRQTLSAGVASENEYGLSLEIQTLTNELRYIGISGAFDHFNSIMGFFPDKKIAFVLLINTESPRAVQLTGKKGIVNAIAELLNKGIINKPTEGNSNHTNFFKLAISQALNVDVSVTYRTEDDTAIAGQDYIATTGTATIVAGQTSTTIGVDIIADNNAEGDESFYLILSNPSGANFPNGIQEVFATHTIIDDD